MATRFTGLVRRSMTFAAALALTFGLFGIARVPTANAACANAQFTIYTNFTGGGSSKTFCIGNGPISNLGFVQGTVWPECGIIHGTDWNDCASSARFVEFGVNTAVCLWSDVNFSGNGLKFVADVGIFNLPAWIDNQGSSIRWGNLC